MIEKMTVSIDKENKTMDIIKEGSKKGLFISGVQVDDPVFVGKAIGSYLLQLDKTENKEPES